MECQHLETDLLVVGGGTGATAAAIQAARRGVSTIIVSEFSWLGGMLTAAGVAVPDGNELAAWQTGLWGQFLRTVQARQPGGVNHSWVSLFSFSPPLGAQILAEWLQQLPSLTWICGRSPQLVLKQGDRILGVRFENYEIRAKITIDGTELGDLLALADIPHRWGWELQSEFAEVSAPTAPNPLTQRYPVQSPTWVFYLQNFGSQPAPPISPPQNYDPSLFAGAWDNYGAKSFINYGRIPGDHHMINWPIAGNDYGTDLGRLIGSSSEKAAFLQESYDHSLNFAYYLQKNLSNTWGLAEGMFPALDSRSSAFALHPYYRESRRLQGQVTVTESMILPQGQVAPLPRQNGQVTSIAIGNYANDHHYPGVEFSLAPKSIRWGGRWTGTPFTIPYQALIPTSTTGFLVCEKNISVSHIANGSTRLQPLVLNIGQAAGMAAALCLEKGCETQELAVRELQEALLTDVDAPAAIIPCYNLPPYHSQWLFWQRHYLDNPRDYPQSGHCPCEFEAVTGLKSPSYHGYFERLGEQDYQFTTVASDQPWQVITTDPALNQALLDLESGQELTFLGSYNSAGNWFEVEAIA